MLDPTPGILVHALRELPREACGVIDEYGEAVPLENVSKEPDRFAFSPEDQLMVWSWPIRAIYHSHVNVGPEPSSRDLQMKSWFPGIPWVIVSLLDPAKPQWAVIL
jgi:proteasome lid subunit RPN8/RPN11